MMDRGAIPTVAEAAEAADVSRATAYRYFPTQSELLEAVLEERLSDITGEALDRVEVGDPLSLLVERGLPALRANEAQMRAALRLSLEQWQRNSEAADTDTITRGGRVPLVAKALEPVVAGVSPADRRRLAIALTLLFGIESWIVLKDIWHLDDDEATSVITWAARALLAATPGTAPHESAGNGANRTA